MARVGREAQPLQEFHKHTRVCGVDLVLLDCLRDVFQGW